MTPTTKQILENYLISFENLVECFIDKYHKYDDNSKDDYHIIGRGGRQVPTSVMVGDYYYRNIDQMYESLKNDIPKRKIFERYERVYENREDLECNFINYCLGYKKPTKKELKESEENIRKLEEELYEQMEKYIKENCKHEYKKGDKKCSKCGIEIKRDPKLLSNNQNKNAKETKPNGKTTKVSRKQEKTRKTS